uniref:Uncharacterized protein n=1 Tax=Rhodnius prolixus TaxID=13249 RepID=T1HRA1_RHOPR
MDGGFKLKELKNIGRPLRLDDLKKERSQKILAAIDKKKPLQLIVAVRNARVSGNAENKSYEAVHEALKLSFNITRKTTIH